MLKVFMMDDMTWVAAESEEQAIDYCTNEMGFDVELTEIEECDINKPNAMWWVIDEFPEGSKLEPCNFLEGDEQVGDDGLYYGWWEGQPARMISYIEAYKLDDQKMPYIIASCNC